MKIAIPVANGILCPHFGHCENFAIIDADNEKKLILKTELVEPPPHEPGILPKWLAEMGVELVIAGGMGGRALELFAAAKIQVVVGAEIDSPENIIAKYFSGTLQTGANRCDH